MVKLLVKYLAWGGRLWGSGTECRAADVWGGDFAPGAGDAEKHTAEFKEIFKITRIQLIYSPYGRQYSRGVGGFLRTRHWRVGHRWAENSFRGHSVGGSAR
jgi:hypothetical protein